MRAKSQPMLRWPVALLLVTLVGSLGAPTLARADAMTDAKDLFDRGRALRVQGDCASAVPLFRKALDLYPEGLGSLRNIAECEESLGRFASARRAWLDLGRTLLTNTAPKYQDWGEDAERAAARLAPKVATLTIDLYVTTPSGETSAAQDVEVTVNGERLAGNLVGTLLERDPGRYIVRAGGPRVKSAQEQTVELTAGQAKRVALGVVVSAEGLPAIAVSPDPSRQAARSSAGATTRRTAAWVAMGVGAAGLIGAGISAIVRQSARNEQDALASANRCALVDGNVRCQSDVPQSARDQFALWTDRGHTATTLVNVFVVVGAVGLASGVVLLAINPSRSTTRASVVLSPTGVSAIGSF